MARRKVAYRKNTHNRFSMLLVTLVVVVIMVVVAVGGRELREKIDVYTAKEEQLLHQLEEEQARTEEIEEYRKKSEAKRS